MSFFQNSIFAGLLVFFSYPGTIFAAEAPLGDAAAYVDSLGGQFIGALQEPPETEERRGRLRTVFDEALDYEAIAKLALGRHWPTATPEQRAEYLDVFKSYVVDLYTAQLDVYSGEGYEVVRERPISDDTTIVSVEVTRPESPSFMLSFRLTDRTGSHKIIDVAVEGVSMVVTKRSEFSSVIGREGIDGLIARLR